MARPPTAVTRGALAALTAQVEALTKKIEHLEREGELRDRRIAVALEAVAQQHAAAVIALTARCMSSDTYSVQSLELLRTVIDNQDKLPAQLINGVAVFLPSIPPPASPSTSSTNS